MLLTQLSFRHYKLFNIPVVANLIWRFCWQTPKRLERTPPPKRSTNFYSFVLCFMKQDFDISILWLICSKWETCSKICVVPRREGSEDMGSYEDSTYHLISVKHNPCVQIFHVHIQYPRRDTKASKITNTTIQRLKTIPTNILRHPKTISRYPCCVGIAERWEGKIIERRCKGGRTRH